MELRDKAALITGGARRIGRAIALRLARSGCRIAIHYRDSEEEALKTASECRQAGVVAEILRADLADVGQTEQVPPRVVEKLGRLDFLINNASIFEPMTVETFNPANWDRTMRINLTAPMILTCAARTALRAGGCGRVVNLCDAAAKRPWPGHLAYATSKGALETLTMALARALAPEVHVVGIAPGVAAWSDDYDQAARERLTARIPLKRAGTAEEIAAAVHFVLSQGDYLTGTILTIDGGRSLL